MTTQQIILLIINVIGGAAVIGSYILGLNSQTGGANALWGGVPTGARSIYFVSMILSAVGYFAFIYFILFRLPPEEVTIAGKFGYSIFYWIFIGMLLPSALWMPLTNIYVNHASTGLWFLIRAVLFIVGLSSAGLVWALLTVHPTVPVLPYRLAIAGSVYFTLHTLILDAFIWAALFKQ